MLVFTTLLVKLLPLYCIVFLGYIAGSRLDVKKESIAQLLIYIISPIIVFYGVVTTELNSALLSLPVLFFILCCLFCIVFYRIGKIFWEGSEKNILAYTCGNGNSGYFGLPVTLALFGDQFLGIAVLASFGFILYDGSLGFFMVARGRHTVKEAISQILHLPVLYAFFFGLVVNYLHISLHPIILETLINFRGMFVVLGMMLIGLGLSQATQTSFDHKFTTIAFLAKFFFWPVLIGLIIFIDKSFFNFYSVSIYQIMLLMSVVPLAANTIAYATKFGTHPEKVSVTVILSTLFALFYIPLFMFFFLGLV